jgi:hypothetical protein
MPLNNPTAKAPRRRAPHREYHTADGAQVPSVTTVLAVIAKPALVKWANRQGLAGIDTEKDRSAATTGTIAHAMVEARLLGKRYVPGDEYTEAEIASGHEALCSYIQWEQEHDVEPIHLEAALVSERRRYGGTLDFYGRIDGRLEVLDFKFARGIYGEHLWQLAAYRTLAVENSWGVRAVRVVRMNRELRPGSEPFSERIETITLPFMRGFLATLKLYSITQGLKEVSAET